MILQWLASPEWANIVKALLHTLWQGAVIVLLLGLALRRLRPPVLRYRCSLAALTALLLAGLVTWAVLNRPVAQPVSKSPAPTAPAQALPELKTDAAVVVVHFPPPKPVPAKLDWTAWLALVWLTGATLMLVRAGYQVAGAERLRRSSQPLDDPRLAGLLADTRRAIGLARRVRLAATERLTSPAVVGVLVPTLILPLSLTTSLTLEQLRFILLHELAHIRRGDYFANLFQLFAEALLFFNPAAWWISRQIRLEREACCDALAIELSGAPAGYAQTLVRVAENVLQPAPAAAATLGDRREPSSLADRIQRLLVPGYRPHLRLTWRAMLTALMASGALLFVTALGTRVTIAAILPPQERIERIEKKMVEYGVNPATEDTGNTEAAPKVKVSGHIRMADGSPVPKWVWLNVNSSRPHSAVGSAIMAKDGQFSDTTPAGTIYIGAEVTNFAPAVLGPLDGWSTNRFENLEIVLDPGFDVPLQVTDADTGKPVTNLTVATMFWLSNNGFQPHSWQPAFDGSLTLTHCADLPLDVTVNVPGYVIVRERFEHLRSGQTLQLKLPRGQIVSGIVLDAATGQPLTGAKIHLLYQFGHNTAVHFEWDDALHVLGQSGADGAFTLNQLQAGLAYYLGVSAPGHESVILKKITADTKGLVVKLGPELIVQGHVTGNLALLTQINNDRTLDFNTTEVFENTSDGYSGWARLRVTNGVATFQFTNRTAGVVTLSGGGFREERNVTAPIDDWVVDLSAAASVTAKDLPRREVIFRFQHPSGVQPRGTVQVTIPDCMDINHRTAHLQEMQITNGEVHVPIAIGGETEIQPQHMVGFWFNQWTVGDNGQMSITVSNGAGPLVINIPLIPAGAIYAKARNADGTPAGGLMFGFMELKRAPGLNSSSTLGNGSDGFSGNAPRKWVSGPLPLGGTYAIYGSRDNSFCVSSPVKLTEANPDAEVELQFPPGQTFHGVVLDADGKPLANAELKPEFVLSEKNSFGLASVYTDAEGRFELDNTTPDLGVYSVAADAPGVMAETVKLKFAAQPQTIRLQRGRTLGGRLVQAGTGCAIPDAELRVWSSDNSLPGQTTHTDDDGRFVFSNLGAGEYTLFAEDGGSVSNEKYEANGNTNLTVAIKLYAWSKAKPKSPDTPAGVKTATGIIPNPNFTAALQALKERTGVNNLSEPEVTTTTGREVNQAPISITRPAFTDPPAPHLPQVLIQGQFYQMPANTFNKLMSEWPVQAVDASSWSASPETLARLQQDLEQSGFTPLLMPRILTTSGSPAQFYMGNETNWTELDCMPVVTNGQVKLTVSGSVMETLTSGAVTNRLNSVAALPNLGGWVGRVPAPDSLGQSNVVMLLAVHILTNTPSAKPAGIQGRQALLSKLKQIRLDSVSFDAVPLSQVLKQLSAQARQHDPDGQGVNLLITTDSPVAAWSTINPLTGLPNTPYEPDTNDLNNELVTIQPALHNVTLEDVFDAIVLTANLPLKYSVEDFAIVFSPKHPEVPRLFMRTFRVNTNAFFAKMGQPAGQPVLGMSTNGSFLTTFRKFISGTNVDWDSPPGKTIFYGERLGVLFVKATKPDLDAIERVLQSLNEVPPQLHLRARFYEVPRGTLEWFGQYLNLTNADGHPMGILTSQNEKKVRQALQSAKGTLILGEPEITVISGRQTQMRSTTVQSIITSLQFYDVFTNRAGTLFTNLIFPVTTPVQTGPILDAAADVLADDNTINLQATASLTEFIGYANVPKKMAMHWITNSAGAPVSLPVVWPAILTGSSSAFADLYDGQTLMFSLNPKQFQFSPPDEKREAVVAKHIQAAQKKNGETEVIILITPTIVDQAGNRVHTDDELPFAQEITPSQPERTSLPPLHPQPLPAELFRDKFQGGGSQRQQR